MTTATIPKNDEIALANAICFAHNVCAALEDMSGQQFSVRSNTVQNGPCPPLYPVTIVIQFYGKISGYFMISMDDATAVRLNGRGETPGTVDEVKRKEAIDLLKELLNVSTGKSLGNLEKTFDRLTYLTPIAVLGEIQFPHMLFGNVNIKGRAGTILCVASLDLASYRSVSKLEEAENKLDAVRISQKSIWVVPDELPEARFSVVYKSLNEAGGDLYDVIKIDENEYGFFVGDVSGHDISTAFIAASMRALIKQNCRAGSDLIESMQTINRVLYELLPDTEYITGCYAVLDRGYGTLKVINMGHPPIVYVPREGAPQSIVFDGDVLGAFEKANYPGKGISGEQGGPVCHVHRRPARSVSLQWIGGSARHRVSRGPRGNRSTGAARETRSDGF